MLTEGTPAPDFTLPDHHGRSVTLSDHRGHWIAFWWFPKAFTAG
jgi:peroxiredoxin Q/BCP